MVLYVKLHFHHLSHVTVIFQFGELNRFYVVKKDRDLYEAWRKNKYPHLVDVLDEFTSLRFDPSFLLVELPRLQPRFYSVSSWPGIAAENANYNYAELTLGVVEYMPIEGTRKHYGVCTKWFDKQPSGESTPVPLFIRE